MFYRDFLLSAELLFLGTFSSIRSRDGVQYDPYSVQCGPYSFKYRVIWPEKGKWEYLYYLMFVLTSHHIRLLKIPCGHANVV